MTEKQVCSRDASSVFFRCSCCKEKIPLLVKKKKNENGKLIIHCLTYVQFMASLLL